MALSRNDYYQRLFDPLTDEPFSDIKPGALVWFSCAGREIRGVLRHLNRADRHFGMNRSDDGTNLGHFGWKVLPNGGHWTYLKTTPKPPKPVPSRKQLVSRFVLEGDS